ncbi:hypothetical protein EV385_5314 [Krasilnikovia cinnamomea]|uniref:V/A-type H+-transporting ATPase subunit E n=1 Tax=Krasilnikovia cinnamomea TaxID=349313 RepID=A0A4Q7ZRG1_9ACTN|nr:hypothetical protein [Krasilnikovia cinnamomea]RZU53391.1 hypothetical protein EV385_5314 [Krasilnikovia cinnamomea]
MTGNLDSLAPVRSALLNRARADAEKIRAGAAAEAGQATAAAQARAEAIRAEAETAGRAEARAAGAAEVAAAGRTARGLILRARREAYEELRDAVRQRLAEDPLLIEVFSARIRRALSPGATLTVVPGGVVGVDEDRQVECTIDGLTDEVLRRLGSSVEDLWSK